MSRIYLPLLLVQLLLQFASVAYGSSGAGLWTSLANEVEVQGGTVTAGSEGTGVAAEGPLGPGQMRSGDVVQTAASNEEMRRAQLLQQQKRQLVGSLTFAIKFWVVLMTSFYFVYISILGPAIEQIKKEALEEDGVVLPHKDAMDRLFAKSLFAACTGFTFSVAIATGAWMFASALLRAIFSQYFRFKVLSLVKYLAQKLHGAEQLNSEQPERKLRQEEQPGSEVDVASTESSR